MLARMTATGHAPRWLVGTCAHDTSVAAVCDDIVTIPTISTNQVVDFFCPHRSCIGHHSSDQLGNRPSDQLLARRDAAPPCGDADDRGACPLRLAARLLPAHGRRVRRLRIRHEGHRRQRREQGVGVLCRGTQPNERNGLVPHRNLDGGREARHFVGAAT